MTKRIGVIGAGFTGAVIARELADKGAQVEIFEARNHVGGNAHDYVTECGTRIHTYGPHLFHTKNLAIYKYFQTWCERAGGVHDYRHRVNAQLSDGTYVVLPVNAATAKTVGRDNVLDIFFRPYTKKMWGMDIEQLNPSILKRVPIRDDDNELYFPNDPYQFLPSEGYTNVISEMLRHDNITVYLNANVSKVTIEAEDYDHVFNCAPIDKWYEYEFGELPWRSIKFHQVVLPMARALPVATVNFTHDGPHTRVTEWSQLPNSPNASMPRKSTILTLEEPCDYKDNKLERYYPIQDLGGRNRELYQTYVKHHSLVNKTMTFVGRCGRYQYIDIDQAIGQALATIKEFLGTE